MSPLGIFHTGLGKHTFIFGNNFGTDTATDLNPAAQNILDFTTGDSPLTGTFGAAVLNAELMAAEGLLQGD